MTIEQLAYLINVAQTHSINQTATYFHISHQGISKALRNMENELAVTLLNRSRKGVTLTADGLFVLEKAQTILNTYQEIKERYPSSAPKSVSQMQVTLSIACIPRLIDSYLDELLSSFRIAYPNITVFVKSLSPSEIITDLNSAKPTTEIGFCAINDDDFCNPQFLDFLHTNNITFDAFSTEEIFACAHHTFFSDIPTCLSKKSSGKYPIIAYKYDFPFHSANHSHYSYEISSIETQRKLIETQLGIGMITNHEFEKFYAKRKKFTLIPFCEPVLFHFGHLLTQGNPSLSPAASLFIQFLRQYFQGIPRSNKIFT